MVVAVALSDVSEIKPSRVAMPVGVTSGHDANKLDAFAYQEPFGIDQSVMTKQDAPRQSSPPAAAAVEYAVSP